MRLTRRQKRELAALERLIEAAGGRLGPLPYLTKVKKAEPPREEK